MDSLRHVCKTLAEVPFNFKIELNISYMKHICRNCCKHGNSLHNYGTQIEMTSCWQPLFEIHWSLWVTMSPVFLLHTTTKNIILIGLVKSETSLQCSYNWWRTEWYRKRELHMSSPSVTQVVQLYREKLHSPYGPPNKSMLGDNILLRGDEFLSCATRATLMTRVDVKWCTLLRWSFIRLMSSMYSIISHLLLALPIRVGCNLLSRMIWGCAPYHEKWSDWGYMLQHFFGFVSPLTITYGHRIKSFLVTHHYVHTCTCSIVSI